LRRIPAVALLAILFVAALAGCTAKAPGGDAVDETHRRLLEQSYEPPYPVGPPPGRPVHIDRATLDPSREVLTVEFIGGNGYLESDGCSEDYTAWVGGTVDRLEVAVVEIDHIRIDFVACLGLGFPHTYHLRLPDRYDGAEVFDHWGATHLVGQPNEAATLARVPDGWSVVLEEAGCCGTEPPVWVQVYSAVPVGEPPHEGPGRLVLYEAFGISDEWSGLRAEKSEGRGGHPEAVTMHGESVTVWVDEASGELLLAWTQDGRSYGLIGNLADMSVDDLTGFAESLTATSE
jgi:hypothetical protein